MNIVKKKSKKLKKKSLIIRILLIVLLLIIIFLMYSLISGYIQNKNIKDVGQVTVKSTVISNRDFLKAIKIGSLDNIEDLLSLGANPKAVDENGRNAMILASIFRKNPQIVTILQAYGVDVNGKDVNGYSPLMFAFIAGAPNNFVKALISEGANVNAINNKGVSVLMVALGEPRQNIKLIKYLIKKGANVNYRNQHKVTPLMVAVKSSNSPALIRYLLKKGANPKVKDDLGFSLYDIIKTNNALRKDKSLVRYFAKYK